MRSRCAAMLICGSTLVIRMYTQSQYHCAQEGARDCHRMALFSSQV